MEGDEAAGKCSRGSRQPVVVSVAHPRVRKHGMCVCVCVCVCVFRPIDSDVGTPFWRSGIRFLQCSLLVQPRFRRAGSTLGLFVFFSFFFFAPPSSCCACLRLFREWGPAVRFPRRRCPRRSLVRTSFQLLSVSPAFFFTPWGIRIHHTSWSFVSILRRVDTFEFLTPPFCPG